jgi:hypothetical protein
MRKSVDLPAPLGPTRATRSPQLMDISGLAQQGAAAEGLGKLFNREHAAGVVDGRGGGKKFGAGPWIVRIYEALSAIHLDVAGLSQVYRRILATSMRINTVLHSLMPRGMGQLASLVILAVLSLSGSLRAQDFEGKTISQVEIRYRGAKTVNEELLRNQMTTKAGTPYVPRTSTRTSPRSTNPGWWMTCAFWRNRWATK